MRQSTSSPTCLIQKIRRLAGRLTTTWRVDIHTTTGIAWSYGAMKGRPQDWASQAQNLPLPTLLDGVVAAGFSGIYIDRYGYADNADSLTKQIHAITGLSPIVSRDQRLEFFNLAPFIARLRARTPSIGLERLGHAILHPPEVVFGDGFYANENGSRWAQGTPPRRSRTCPARRADGLFRATEHVGQRQVGDASHHAR